MADRKIFANVAVAYRVEDHVRILATLVPDEVIYNHNSESATTLINGVLLFVDVSGFTDLCEKYNALGKGGPSRITQVLNAYIGAMVQEIMSHGGDILKFSGDAFLALWKTSDDLSMSDVVHAAIDCALGIQRSHGSYNTEVGIVLRVKIALAAGSIAVSIIGDSNYMILGKTLLDVKDIGNVCGAGDIIMHHTMEKFISTNEYLFDRITSTNNLKVLNIGSEWTPSSVSNQFDVFDTFAMIKPGKREDDDEETEHQSEYVVMNDDDETTNRASQVQYAYMLRPSLDYAANNNLMEYIRKFVIPPVVQAVESNSPLDYLTEMRQVVIVFINVVILPDKTLKTLKHVCDVTYKIVCDTVQKEGGCVNKVSIFDKDLMFLVVFGLRGFKRALETQKALYSARVTLDLLQNVSYVESAAVGVTSGKTYCGVVGHPMRKEYTVIGRTVNKAARLMIAYPDIVACDSQTFLQSNLQARFFHLLPQRYLKGFKNVGPVYKFVQNSEVEQVEPEMEKVQNYPLLGRENEMEFFLNVIINKRKNLNMFSETYLAREDLSYYNMMIIQGKDRQGKTRLLYEMIYYISDRCPYIFYSFTPQDRYHPFKFFQIVFDQYCDLSQPDINIRTKNVLEFMTPFKVPEFLCALNKILLVKFEETKYWNRLTDEEKFYVKFKMVKYLSVKAFKKKMCIIFLDNTENMDEKSWGFIRAMLNTKYVFVCATMSPNVNVGNQCDVTMKRSDVKIITLQPILKYYMAGLICQFLNVHGIDVELERFIHLNSNGNPGWIESFLTIFQHSDGIIKADYKKNEAISLGFVLPPYEMLTREELLIAGRSTSVLQVDLKDNSFIASFEADIEDWDIFSQTIREDKMTTIKSPNDLKICITAEGTLENLDNEDVLDLDVEMVQRYDLLKVHEQLLLKCCSILGNSFSRQMLEYVMQNQSERQNAEAIKTLFEIRIFNCCRAIYNNGAIDLNHHLKNPNLKQKIECSCTGFPINPECADLPKYANCGYIRFRDSGFRDMVVNLLTDSQANLYHVRCVWYLESQTRRCLTCNLGYFTTLIGQSNDDIMRALYHNSSSYRKTKELHELCWLLGGFIFVIDGFHIHPRMNYKFCQWEKGMKRNSVEVMSSFIRYRSNLKSSSITVDSNDSSDSVESETLLRSKQLPSNINFGLQIHMYRTFADNIILGCACDEILITMYKQMMEHCKEAGMNEKLMHVLLEYADVCIRNKNYTVAFTLIDKANKLLETKLKYEFSEPAWQIPLVRGKIMLLTGTLNVQLEAYDEAEKYLLEAMKCFNLKFPKNKIDVNREIVLNLAKQKLIVNYFPHRYIGSRNEDVCTLADDTAEVLNNLFTIYRTTNKFKKAYLTTIWAMNEALRSDSNFDILCWSYANLLYMDLMYNKRDLTRTSRLEEMATAMCFRKHTRLEKYEMSGLGKLYAAIFLRKFFCQNVMESLEVGKIAFQFNLPEYGQHNRWLMLQCMIFAYIFTYNTMPAATSIKKLDFFKETNNISYISYGPLTYYYLCLVFRIYTTYAVEHMANIEEYSAAKVNRYNEPSSLNFIQKRNKVSLWLWYVRKMEWESAGTLYETIYKLSKLKFNGDTALLWINIHLLEGFLLTVVKKINICDYEGMKYPKEFVTKMLENMCKLKGHICLRSRLFLLKAYYLMIFKHEKEAYKQLDLASEFAKKCNVLYDYDWIEYTRELWLNHKQESNDHDDPWQKATNEEIFIDLDNTQENLLKIPFFSLRLPKH